MRDENNTFEAFEDLHFRFAVSEMPFIILHFLAYVEFFLLRVCFCSCLVMSGFVLPLPLELNTCTLCVCIDAPLASEEMLTELQQWKEEALHSREELLAKTSQVKAYKKQGDQLKEKLEQAEKNVCDNLKCSDRHDK